MPVLPWSPLSPLQPTKQSSLQGRCLLLRPLRSLLVATAVALTTTVFTPSVSLAAASKVDATFDPHPTADDVLVPMPCNGVMVFKKVYTGNSDKLKDKGFNAGSPNSESLVAQAPNHRYVQGGFHDSEGYYYLMSKYELNAAQYQLLTNYEQGKGKCTEQKYNVRDRMAQANISWFDAIELTRQYSYFLATNEAKSAAKAIGGVVPTAADGKTVAFARLPTDSEWEYAARGGNAVTSSQFSAEVFPLEGSIADYAWYKGQDSAADAKVRVIGLKKPNPLGLYDILGNVSEMMLDPFYATRTGRLHGQSGGFIVRGGSVLSAKSDMITAYRSEKPFFTRGKESTARDMGVRLVLSVPVTTSINEVRALNEEIAALGQDSDAEDIKGGGNLNTVAALDKIIAEQKEAQQRYEREQKALSADNEELAETNAELMANVQTLQESLTALRLNMVEANSKRDEMRDRAIVSALRLGGYLCSTLASEQIALERNLKNEEIIRKLPIAACRTDKDSAACKKAVAEQEERLKANRELAVSMVDYYASYYADHITDTSDTYDLKFIAIQERNAQKSLGKSEGTLANYIEQFVVDVGRYAKGGSRNLDDNKERWVKQCRALVGK